MNDQIKYEIILLKGLISRGCISSCLHRILPQKHLPKSLK